MSEKAFYVAMSIFGIWFVVVVFYFGYLMWSGEQLRKECELYGFDSINSIHHETYCVKTERYQCLLDDVRNGECSVGE